MPPTLPGRFWSQLRTRRAAAFQFFLCLGFVCNAVSADGTNANPIAIPIDIRSGRVLISTKVNGSQSLRFLVDTGYGIDTIRPDLVESLGLQRAGRVTILGIAGEEKASTYSGVSFEFGGAGYNPRRVAALPSEAQNRRRRDGILGAGFFRRFVVEIDLSKKVLSLYEPESFHYDGKGEIIPLVFRKDTPIVEATLLSPAGSVVPGRFEIDTGCDGALCLGRDFVQTNQLADEGKTSSETRRGVGGGARISSGSVPELRLGRFTMEKPSANFFTDGSPAGAGLAGHIGMDALRHYIVIFDYSRDRMILEHNP